MLCPTTSAYFHEVQRRLQCSRQHALYTRRLIKVRLDPRCSNTSNSPPLKAVFTAHACGMIACAARLVFVAFAAVREEAEAQGSNAAQTVFSASPEPDVLLCFQLRTPLNEYFAKINAEILYVLCKCTHIVKTVTIMHAQSTQYNIMLIIATGGCRRLLFFFTCCVVCRPRSS